MGQCIIVGDEGRVLVGAPDWSGGAFGEVGLQAGRDAKNAQDLPDSRQVMAVGVAEDNNVIGIERDAGTGVPGRETTEKPEINQAEKHGVEDVDDDGE